MKLERDFWPILAIDIVASLVVARFTGLMGMKSDLLKGIQYASDNVFNLAAMPPIPITQFSVIAGFVVFLLIMYAYFHHKMQGTFRRGEEHGSSKWITREEFRAFGDFDTPLNNTILSEEGRLRYVPGKGDYEHRRNRNILLIGGSGSGKTRGYYKPNIMQVPAPELAGRGKLMMDMAELDKYARSYFITDPKGTTRTETGYVVAEHGYKVKEFNLINPEDSMCYNPIKYIRGEEDVMSFATCLIKNTTPPDGANSGDPFWENSEKLLYQALIEYMRTEVPKEQRNLNTLCQMLDMGDVDDTGGMLTGLDILFEELEKGKRYDPIAQQQQDVTDGGQGTRDRARTIPTPWVDSGREPQPNHPGVLAYRSFSTGAADTKRSIMISCKVRLAPLRPKKIQRILERDEMELDRFGEEKICCYAIMSASDPTYNFLFAMMIWQLFNELMRQGTLKYNEQGGALPVGVDFLMDEFANYYVPNFEKTISVIRSYNLGAHIGVQSNSQLKENYGEDNATTIMNNCDTLVFLGGKANETNEELAKIMGQQTVTTDNESDTHAENSSWSKQIAQHGRDLMQASEIAKMDKNTCLVLIQGADPYIGKKYEVTKHPLYEYIDPGKGRRFERGFSFAAYRSNPKYYDCRDARLEVTVEMVLRQSRPAAFHPPREYAYSMVAKTTVRNVGTDTAYDVRGNATYTVRCLSNEKDPRNPEYPAMEPFGTSEGLMFAQAETYSSKVTRRIDGDDIDSRDYIEWNDSDDMYKILGYDIAPGDEIIYTTSLAASVDEVKSRMNGFMGAMSKAGQPKLKVCEFLFDFEIALKSANADSVGVHEDRIVVIGNNGNAGVLA